MLDSKIIIAIVIVAILVAVYYFYWRTENYVPRRFGHPSYRRYPYRGYSGIHRLYDVAYVPEEPLIMCTQTPEGKISCVRA